MGVLQALTDIPTDVPMLLQVDSQYALNVTSKWIYTWKSKDWKRPNGGEILNLDLVKAIDKAMSARKALTQFEWVQGHSGHPLNEEADKRAATAARHAQIGNSASSGPGYTRSSRKPLFPNSGY
jgi:ribonuclease HI